MLLGNHRRVLKTIVKSRTGPSRGVVGIFSVVFVLIGPSGPPCRRCFASLQIQSDRWTPFFVLGICVLYSKQLIRVGLCHRET